MERKEEKHIDYKLISSKTGKSVSTIKKWRLRIEKLSGYNFKKAKHKVSRYSTQIFYKFTDEEVSKFIEVNLLVNKTNNLDQAIKQVWGDLETQLEQDSKEMINDLRKDFQAYQKKSLSLIQTLDQNNRFLSQRLTTMRERLDQLEEEKIKDSSQNGKNRKKKNYEFKEHRYCR
ncbi:hypothetical protein [Streptococcus catagoni]|uniref:hypothetical protein n=1 Tax=Streptococcus catagoni TaxID=2654874 RepID=UPI001F1AB782|nr:hypothetical protein [Streptococcus catagoni]